MPEHNTTLKGKFALYIQNNYIFLKAFFGFVLLFNIFRTLILIAYKPSEGLNGYYTDVFWAYINGFRFDAVVILYALLLITGINTIALLISFFSDVLLLKTPKIIQLYLKIIFPILVLVLSIDYYFFSYYHTHINLLVFGFWEDETKTILSSIISDFPIIKLTLLLVIVIILGNKYIIPKITSIKSSANNYSYIYITFFFIFFNTAHFFGMRGTWSGRVLCLQENGVISNKSFVNDLMPNGLFTFREALEQRAKNELIKDPKVAISNYGITDEHNLFDAYKQMNESNEDIFFSKTEKNSFLEINKPNILFLQMESMGSDLLSYQSKNFDVLGELKNNLDSAYFFDEFTCGNIMTIHSLEGLLINALITPVSYTANYQHQYSSSNLIPFLKNGYETQYVTGGRLSWHNLEKFLPSQGFQKVDGSSSIAKRIKNATEMEWGVADEYFFDYIYESLLTQKKPQFIYGMSISNHTPFDVPDDYKPTNLDMPEAMKGRLGCYKDVAERNVKSYRYANDMLGKFLKKIKANGLDKNLIIVITGDHFCHDLFNYNDDELYMKYRVPCIYLVPPKYRPTQPVNTHISASHKDIFTTLFNLTLSDTRYYHSGLDMLNQKHISKSFSFTKTEPGSVNYFTSNANGVVKKVLNNYNYYTWDKSNRRKLVATNDKDTALQSLKKQSDVFNAAMDFYQLSDQKR
ncbi:MAG: sulfatase-like hydrolase/transferase [Bacteroidetes bacterium]|nr:sulfatase-like hydrolase/transferase [Bacteroidota bacterium]